jgi:hypothetical protein
MLDLQTALQETRSMTVPMTQIRVRSRKELEINGKVLPMSDTAFKDLLKLVGLTHKTVNHLNENLAQNAGFAIVKELMRAMSQTKGNISLVINKEDKEIKRICKEGDLSGSETSIAPGTIQDMISYALDKSDRVKLSNTFVSDGGTKVAFNLKWDNPIALTLPGEDISFGKQIVWDLLGPTAISDFVERQICTNGMTGIVPGKAQFLDASTTPSEWYKQLYEDLVNPNKDKIVHYQDRIADAVNSNLSVYEYNKIKSHLMENWSGDGERITRYLGDESWKTDYINKGIKLDTLNVSQLRNCPTPVNSWDAVNCLTDMASHSYTTPVSDRVKRDTQRLAGKFINKGWDSNQQIFNTPTYKVTKPGGYFSMN